jgi:flagellar hook-associated protein 3 FlgL
VDSIAASARDALGQVANALNTKDGDVYVFAGQDTANPPVPNEANILKSGYFTAINTAVAGFTGTPPNDAATVANTTYGVATSNAFGTTSPFSDFLSQPSATVRAALPVVQIGQSQTETVGLPASANGLMPDTPPGTATLVGGPVSSTGSYMRDIMRALATIGSLSSAQAGAPGFQDLVQDTRVSLTGAITSIAQDAGALGNVQTSLKATQSQLGDTETALTGQVSSAEQVDMAATLSQLSLVQTQMQASYQLISTLNSMSLVKFLPVG